MDVQDGQDFLVGDALALTLSRREGVRRWEVHPHPSRPPEGEGVFWKRAGVATEGEGVSEGVVGVMFEVAGYWVW